ncbi:glycosyltransferase [Pararhizobium sp. IMCC21322]|uniref:glycosyltransferase n=1 Tax=Pararhizobium sp. IMCC21322 TaxID=3067903 RepID=UPI00274035D9|nr:glycosyltransferase [Pararhizobium sp. IMCC21322]
MIQIAEPPTQFGPLANVTDTFHTVANSLGKYVFAGMTDPQDRLHDITRHDAFQKFLRTNKVANFLGSSREHRRSDDQKFDLWLNIYRKRTALLNAACLAHISKISNALVKADVEFIVFKGVIQQKILYGSYFVKPAGDVDLLVHGNDFKRARDVLGTAGFAVVDRTDSSWWVNFLGEQHFEPHLPGSPAIDLHYRIQQPGSPQPTDTGEFIKRKQFVDVAGIKVPFMHPDDFLLMSSISIAKAMFNREPCGGHIADVHASLCNLRTQDITAIQAFSKQQGLSAILSLGLRSAKAVLNVDHPMTKTPEPEILASVSDASLKNLLLLPEKNASNWPKRRQVLWELCERSPARFASESLWAISADVSRRITQEKRTAKPRQSAEVQNMANSHGHENPVETLAEGQQHSRNAKSVCVIIAAFNAEDSIARAVTSALNQAEVSEVIVVDDASTDQTVVTARLAEDGTNRLKLIELSQNVGPAEARNIAIDNSHAPLIAVLDADDFFLKDRFKPLIEDDDWDFIGDNIVFLDEEAIGTFETTELLGNSPKQTTLSFAEFIAGNISKRGLMRGELGFLKPVMKRGFLQAHGIRYQRNLRLGEDYELYSRALLKQARFKISPSLGYAAIIRSNSLSAKHQTSDLEALVKADRSMLDDHALSAANRSMLMRHERHIHSKFALREFLDLKKDKTAWQALKFACSNPSIFLAVFSGIAFDKIGKIGLTKSQKPPANIYRDQQVLFPVNGIGANQ